MTLTPRQNVVAARPKSAVIGKRANDEIRSLVTMSIGETCGARLLLCPLLIHPRSPHIAIERRNP
ncbi:hypothetical protein A5627_05715 [Mycobacterium colombiense]|nr:hypothetical protein A5627_05715 [Mycobacterium colombiense]